MKRWMVTCLVTMIVLSMASFAAAHSRPVITDSSTQSDKSTN